MKQKIKDALVIAGLIIFLIVVLTLQGCSVLASKPATVICQAADAVTTVKALQLGAVEVSPFMPHTVAGVLIVKALVTWALLRWHDDIDPGARAVINVVSCGAAIHNVGVIKDQRSVNGASP